MAALGGRCRSFFGAASSATAVERAGEHNGGTARPEQANYAASGESATLRHGIPADM